MKRTMKIVLIGPVYPYKGGIAHYTSLLCQALRQKHEVQMLSYKMQYPKFLFKREQKDYSNKKFQIEDAKYWINTANPFNIVASAIKIRKWRPDAVIIQWWHPYFAPCYWILCRILGKIPVIFTCHNVFPHERFPLDRFLTNMTLRSGKGFIVQSKKDAEDLKSIKKDANYLITPHPTYDVFRMKNLSKQDAREILRIDANKKVLLFFGFVREYKGLHFLLDAVKKIHKKEPDIQLWVVGDFGEDRGKYINKIRENQIEECVNLVEGYIPDEEVEKYFMASDLVVLPYISATQSGIVQIAYGFEKPVVVTNVGGLPDVVDNEKTGYVVASQNVEAIANAILKFYREDKNINWEENIREKSVEFSWDKMVEKIETMIASV